VRGEKMQPVENTTPNPRSHKKLWILVIGGIVGLMIPFFASPVLTVVFVVQPVRIEGRAMAPTLNDGDRVLINKKFGELKRGHLVRLSRVATIDPRPALKDRSRINRRYATEGCFSKSKCKIGQTRADKSF
jgi:signal peptidase I